MSVSTLVIPADSAQVRVVRLVATAAARRAGLDEDMVDEVRLAVGEAVARAVMRSSAGEDPRVRVRLEDLETGFAVEVVDSGDRPDEDAGFAMAVISGLVPDVDVDKVPGGGQTLRMSWTTQD